MGKTRTLATKRRLWASGWITFALGSFTPEHAWAQADALSPQELVTRCFLSLADIRLPFNDVRRADIQSQAKALELCDALIDAPRLNLTAGSIQSNQSRIRTQEAKDLIRRFHQFHETFFKSDKYEHVYNEFGYTKLVQDTGVPAAYFTLGTFSPVSDYSLAVTEPSALQVIRGGTAASRAGNLVRNPTTNPDSLTRYIGSEVFGADRGLFSGIKRITAPSTQVSSGGVPPANEASATFPPWQYKPSQVVAEGWSPLWRNTLGGGFMGDPSFLLLNSGMPIDKTSNGSMTLPRRWSREVMNAAFCRNGPYLKLGQIPQGDLSNAAGRPPFRTDQPSGCMQCHSTMDPMAIGIKNLRISEVSENLAAAPSGTWIAPEQNIFYPVLYRLQAGQILSPSNALPNAFTWPAPASGITNFHKSRVHGRLTFTNSDGNLFSQTFDANPQNSDQLNQLGSLIRNSGDYYLCGAIRYFELLSGVRISLESESLPELSASTSAYEKKVFQDLKPLAQQFASTRNTRELLKQLIRTPQFTSRSWGRKTPSNWVRVSSVQPNSGPSGGGIQVVITGANFGAGTTVRIGGSNCAINYQTSQEIRCITGPRAAATVSVDVQKGTQLDVLPNAFTYITAPTYTEIKNNIFNVSCTGCHNANGQSPNLAGNHATLMASGVIDVANPAQSMLYRRVTGNGVDPMPPGGGLGEQQKQSILLWIQSGAPNN
jgi:hypothetical protein